MRMTTGFAFCFILISAAANAQEPLAATRDQGVVYRLSDAEKESLLNRVADRSLQTSTAPLQRSRPGKAARIGLGILGFFGVAAAETAIQRRCAGSLQCEDSGSGVLSYNSRVLP